MSETVKVVEITGSRESFRKYASEEVFGRIREMQSISEMLVNSVSEYSEQDAVLYNGIHYTFAQLGADTAAFRTVLKNEGVTVGTRVLLHMPNSYELVIAFLAVATLGASAAIAPAQLPAQAVGGIGMQFGCNLIVGSAVDAEIKGIKVLSGVDMSGGPTPVVEVNGETECTIMFTGGTTGRSKGAVLSNRAVMQGVVNGCYGYEEVFGQRYLLALPISHVFGLIRGVLASIYTGSCVAICSCPQEIFRDAAVFKPTLWIAVPALAEMALSLSRKFKRMMLGESMRTIIAGAAAVPPYLIEEYLKWGIRVFPGYGLTESANLVSGNPEFREKSSSVGLPFPNQKLRIENGELLLKGDNMLTAYIGTEEKAYDENGWFHTGDLAHFDEDGFLYITGRSKEIIVLPNGENVSPAEVEAKFNELKYVQDCQLFESENEGGIAILALEVVPRAEEMAGVEDAEAFLMPQLEEINNGLPSYCRAVKITIRDKDFERSPSMKILRYKKKHEQK